MKISIALLSIGLATLVAQVHASSPDAWAEHQKTVLATCSKLSSLKRIKQIGDLAEFDDRAGYSALLLQGKYPQEHMKGQTGIELCLFDKKTKTAYVSEWDSIRPGADR